MKLVVICVQDLGMTIAEIVEKISGRSRFLYEKKLFIQWECMEYFNPKKVSRWYK